MHDCVSYGLNHWSQPVFAEAVAALLPMVDMGTDESLNDALAEKVTPRLGAFVRRHEGSSCFEFSLRIIQSITSALDSYLLW